MITEIDLKNFRLFNEYHVNVNSSLVIFSGKNATGKTSILESIYLCSSLKSHRTNDLDELIGENSEYSVIKIKADNKNFRIALSKNGKNLSINSKEIKKNSDFVGNINAILFSPSDISIIDGGKSERRHFLDLELSLADRAYMNASVAYKKLLKERNELLKQNKVDEILLDVLTKELIRYLEVISSKRIEFISKLNNELSIITKNLNTESILLKYNKTYGEDIYQSFKNKYQSDMMYKTTNIGTHRDDFDIEIDNKSSSYASVGQARTSVIAIKLALKEYLKHEKGNEPILLLDDVFATLDKKRIESITNYVLNSKQVFITTTSVMEIPDELLKRAMVVRIENKK